MDMNTKSLCKGQLDMLAESFASKDGKELSLFILRTCASLLGTIEKNTPADSLEEKDLKDLIHGYSLVYYVMNPFLENAAKTLDVAELQKQLKEMNERYQKEVEALEKAKNALEETRKKLENAKTEAESLRSSEGGLLGEYDKAVKELERLNRLKEEYSPEKLTAAEKECAKLREETEVLSQRHEVINQQTGECLGEISASLGILREHIDAEREQVDRVRETADDFKNGIAVLEKVYKEYEGWFHVLETPAHKFVQEVGQGEMDKLKGVMDEDTLLQTNRLVRETKDNLEALSKIVKAGARASQTDYDKVIECAGK